MTELVGVVLVAGERGVYKTEQAKGQCLGGCNLGQRGDAISPYI